MSAPNEATRPASPSILIEGIGFWASGIPDWTSACAFLRDGQLAEGVARKPAPTLLAPNERRRAPDTVALALQVALAACEDANADPAQMPSVFASTHGDLAITDYMCATLTDDPRSISPTRFHNSVHNAAAGYWTIGTHCMQPATAISAYHASFAQGLLEAMAQLVDGAERVLLVAYDSESAGPLAAVSTSRDLLAAALVLSLDATRPGTRMRLSLASGSADTGSDPLSSRYAGNAMAPMLPLLAHVASGRAAAVEPQAGVEQRLCVELSA
jgi:hypothetical protein